MQLAFVDSLLSNVMFIKFVMADVDDLAIADAIYGVVNIVAAFQLRRKRRHSQWVRPWILQRPVCGAYNKLFSDLLNTDEVSFRLFFTCFINSSHISSPC